MEKFIQQHGKNITGVVSGFDRLVLRGSLRLLSFTAGMMGFLSMMGVLLKEFGEYVEGATKQLKAASVEEAERLGRPIRYLQSSRTDKELIARKIAKDDRIEEGLICILKCVEPCMSYDIRRDPERKELVLEPRLRKCLHLYHYWIDPVFGFMSARIQTWFPFTIQVCLNGREWLGRQMDKRGIRYERRKNCFVGIEQAAEAQKLMDKQLRISWPRALKKVSKRVNPAHRKMFGHSLFGEYYWSVHQSEWATDVMFRSTSELSKIYTALVHGGIAVFSSRDVMRFLGRKMHGSFQGEVVSDYRERPEGIRVRHRVGANSVKVYDKQGSILRVETTINDPKGFKVYRPKEGEPDGPREWRPMRKGIADLHRRAQVSQQSNERYLEALASLDTHEPTKKLVAPMCRAVVWKGQRVRGIRPWSSEDRDLLETISRGEFVVNGMRNRNIVQYLYGGKNRKPEDIPRLASRVTRKLRMLRAHGIIKKVPRTHRYLVTARGKEAVSAALKLQVISLNQLTDLSKYAGYSETTPKLNALFF